MSECLHLISCPFLKKELENVLKDEQFLHLSFGKGAEESAFSSEKLVAFSDDLKVLRLGCAAGVVNIKRMLQGHHECIELVLGKRKTKEILEKQKQILLPSMLTHLCHALEAGVDKTQFSYLKDVVILDTQTSPTLAEEIAKIKLILGIPIESLLLPLDFLEQKIEMHSEIWQQYQNMALINENLFYAQKEKANYAIILDFISRIQKVETGKKILDDFLDLVVMISGTSEVFFLSSEPKDSNELISFSQPPSEDVRSQFPKWIEGTMSPEKNWQLYPMKYRETLLGTLLLRSENTERLSMISTLLLALLNFTALALDKLKNMNELAHQKELEAIHAMVATYNHEINNPLSIAIGYLNIAEKKQDMKYLAEVKLSLSKIEEIVHKISEITSKNLDFASYTQESQRLKID